MKHHGFDIVIPDTGGKAGKGCNKTSTVQVREPWPGGDYLLLKQYRFTVGDPESVRKATAKALEFVNNLKSPTPTT